jgi:hypothetical protein
MKWLPEARLEVTKVAVVTPLKPLSVACPILVNPSKKVTVPNGLP